LFCGGGDREVSKVIDPKKLRKARAEIRKKFSKKQSNTKLLAYLLIVTSLIYILGTVGSQFIHISMVQGELKYEKEKFGSVIGRYRLAGWVLEHFIYDPNYIGHCKNPEKCVEEIDKTGYFSGVCDDVSRVFAYLYIKQGYGDPLIVILRLNSETRHTEVVFFDGEQIYVFYGLPGDIEEIHFASDYLGINANRKPEDIYLYDLVRTTGVVTTAKLEDYARIVNGGTDKISPYIVDGAQGVIRIKGRFLESDCPVLSVDMDCFGSQILLGMAKNVCKISVAGENRTYYVLKKFG
jgi:hypothetical protein